MPSSRSYHIEQLKPKRRGSLELGTPPVMEWQPQPYWGEHPTPLAAMRRYVEELEPDAKGMPNDWIRRQWRAWNRSQGVRTAVSTPSPSPCPSSKSPDSDEATQSSVTMS